MKRMQVSLRGERDYIHSTSIFDSIISLRKKDGIELKNIDFSMRRFTNKQCYLTTKGKKKVNEEEIIGDYHDACGAMKILELQEDITERTPYPEHEIIDQCSIHEKKISVPAVISNYTFIEKLIAAYKALLQQLFGASGNFFFFIRLTLDHIPFGPFEITYDRIISSKYYQGTITAQDNKIGLIFFGVQKT
ncbi:MAG: hypothetical protein D3909_07490 [Candidatus Electrothrix sp. ATG1]|nr:hypothetical protein [Candidatus Electrothrix sp. ATG1]